MDQAPPQPLGGHKCAACPRIIPYPFSHCPQCLAAAVADGGIPTPTTAADLMRLAVASRSDGAPAVPAPPPWSAPLWLRVIVQGYLPYFAVVAVWALFLWFTDVLLTWPYAESGMIACLFVAGSGWILALVKRKNDWQYGCFKVLVGCGLGIWALTDGRVEQGKPPVIALWISLLLAVDFAVDGFEQVLSWYKKEDGQPALQAVKPSR